VLLCHHDEPFDLEGLAAWLATTMRLVGLAVVHERTDQRWRAIARERCRTGWIGLLDAVAFRLYYRIAQARRDRAWARRVVARLRATYPVPTDAVPRIDVADPNGADVQAFVRHLAPDLALARVRPVLARDVVGIPSSGTFRLHPGICPEYRNADGCFWALSRRDLAHVGLTLLRIDADDNTGPVFLEAGCQFDELRESHRRIDYRVVLDNLDAIRRSLIEVVEERRRPIDTRDRLPAVWGHPRLSAYVRWKRAARRSRNESSRLAALS
jgi:hypothetical protein